MPSRSPNKLDQSLTFSLVMPAYWLCFVVAGGWMAGQIMLPLGWWMDEQDVNVLVTKLALKCQLTLFFCFFYLFTGLWAHAAIARIRAGVDPRR